MSKPTIIALHGDGGSPDMILRDMGDLALMVDKAYDGNRWCFFEKQYSRLLKSIRSLGQPPILIGYSRGGDVIAKLSNDTQIAAAVLYESPVIDSETVGGEFPCLMIWNDQGAKVGPRRLAALHSEELWKQNHPVDMLTGRGGHIKRKPFGHAWDTSLNPQIAEWIEKHYG